MAFFKSITLLLATFAATSLAQNVTVPDTCTDGYEAGTSTVIYTVPYTYDQVLSVIGNYSNLTWSGSPAGSVTLNGTDNTVGTARTYDIDGAHVIETILIYSKPPQGPYDEVHNTALLSIPTANISFYIIYDGTTVTPICNGLASQFNFTANHCSTNGTLGTSLLSQIHLGDAETVGKFLGGQNFTSCTALGMSASGTSSTTAPVSTFTGSASGLTASVVGLGMVTVGIMWTLKLTLG